MADELVYDENTLHTWLETLLIHGSFWNEAVLIAAAHRREADVAELATALASSAERYRETLDQGAAFLMLPALGAVQICRAKHPYPSHSARSANQLTSQWSTH